MKKICLVTCGVVAICLMVTALAAGEKRSVQTKPNIEQLTGQIGSLQAKVKTLEERLQKMEQAGIIVTLPSAPRAGGAPTQGTMIPWPANNIVIPGAAVDPNHPPKIWGEGECNGWKYYNIPLSAHDSDTRARMEAFAR